MVVEAVQNYVTLVNGLTKMTREKALATARAMLVQAGLDDVATDAQERVAKLAEEILLASKANRELLDNLIATEVDRAASRLGFVRSDEVDELRQEIADLKVAMAYESAAAAAASAKPAPAPVKRSPASSAAPVRATPTKTETPTKSTTPATKATPANRSTAKKTTPVKASTPAMRFSSKPTPAKTTPAKKVSAKKTAGATKTATTSKASPARTAAKETGTPRKRPAAKSTSEATT